MNFFKLSEKQRMPPLKNIKFFKQKTLNNKYFYIDFQNEQSLINLQKQYRTNPHQDLQIQIIGKNYITNLPKLPEKTFRLVRYLSQSKTLSDRKKQLQKILAIKRRSLINQKETKQSKTLKYKISNKMSPNVILQYLQNRQNKKLLKSLNSGQNKLVQSISSISQIQFNGKGDEKKQTSQNFMKRMNFPLYFRNSSILKFKKIRVQFEMKKIASKKKFLNEKILNKTQRKIHSNYQFYTIQFNFQFLKFILLRFFHQIFQLLIHLLQIFNTPSVFLFYKKIVFSITWIFHDRCILVLIKNIIMSFIGSIIFLQKIFFLIQNLNQFFTLCSGCNLFC